MIIMNEHNLSAKNLIIFNNGILICYNREDYIISIEMRYDIKLQIFIYRPYRPNRTAFLLHTAGYIAYE